MAEPIAPAAASFGGQSPLAIRRPGPQVLATLALVGVAFLWGTSFVATKPVLGEVPPMTLALLRVVVALAVLLPILRRSGRRPARGVGPALLGLSGTAVAIVCQNLGVGHAGAGDATVILGGGIPVLTLLLARLVLGERLGGRRLAALGLSLAGVASFVLLGGGGSPDAGGSILGAALLLLAAGSLALYNVVGRRAFAGDGLAALVGSFGYGALFLLPAAAVEQAAGGWRPPPAATLPLLLYLGVACSALALLLNGYALARLEAGRAAAVLNLELPFGVGAAALLLGESISGGHLAGGALIVAGAVLASGGHRPGPVLDAERGRGDLRAVDARSPASGSWPGAVYVRPAKARP